MTASDWETPLPFVVIAASRAGGTFLCSCLDSHPDIGCERDTPMRADSVWAQAYPGISDETILRQIVSRPGYQAAGCKVPSRWFIRQGGYDILCRLKPRLIHLYRENVVRVSASALINTLVRRGELEHPMHTYHPVPSASIAVDVGAFIDQCDKYVESVALATEMIERAGLPTLTLTYADLVGGEGREEDHILVGAARPLCDFLEVAPLPLVCSLRRVNPQPLRKLITNWNELADALRGTRHARWLADEEEQSECPVTKLQWSAR